MTNKKQGQIFVISGPSGVGKSSLLKELLARVERLRLSISHTTRQPRCGEEDGREYHFVDEKAFQRMVEDGEFLEHARVFGSLYGTSRRFVSDQLADGECDVVLELDWQGAGSVRKAFSDAVTIFILPPSKDHLYQRLVAREQDSETVIKNRMDEAISEMKHYNEFNHAIINDDFDKTCQKLERIVRGEDDKNDTRALSETVLSDLGLRN